MFPLVLRKLFADNANQIDWSELSTNPAAIDYLRAHSYGIDWIYFCANPAAIDQIESIYKLQFWVDGMMNKFDWIMLSMNSAAINLIKNNLNRVDWLALSFNPAAIEILKANPDKIDWYNLSMNPNAIGLLTANPDKIDWNSIWHNPSIFTRYDYDTFKKSRIELHKDLIEYLYHPDKIAKHLEFNNDLDNYLI